MANKIHMIEGTNLTLTTFDNADDLKKALKNTYGDMAFDQIPIDPSNMRLIMGDVLALVSFPEGHGDDDWGKSLL